MPGERETTNSSLICNEPFGKTWKVSCESLVISETLSPPDSHFTFQAATLRKCGIILFAQRDLDRTVGS